MPDAEAVTGSDVTEEPFPTASFTVSHNFKDNLLNASINFSSTEWPPSTSSRQYDALQYAMLFYVPFIILFGTVGNILSGIVMARKTFHKLPVSVYLLAMAVFDTVFLFANGTFRMWVGLVFHVQFSQISSLGCKIYVYLLYSSKSISSWLIVAVTVERAIVIALPHKSRVLSTRRRSLYVLAAVVTCALLYFICMLYSFELVQTELAPEPLCFIRDRTTYNVLHVIDVFLYIGIPFIILIVANCILVRSLFNRVPASNDRKPTPGSISQSVRITVLVLLINCAFIALTLPMGVINLLISFNIVVYKEVLPIWTSLYLVNVTNHGVNFVFYCLSGSMFRKEVLKLCPKSRRGSYATNSSNNKRASTLKTSPTAVFSVSEKMSTGRYNQYNP